jgi:hypothetical protein
MSYCRECSGEGRVMVHDGGREWHWEPCLNCVDSVDDEMSYSDVERPYARCWDDGSSWEPSTEDDLPW